MILQPHSSEGLEVMTSLILVTLIGISWLLAKIYDELKKLNDRL